jgi:branched-chain amino acid transport system substrate-binding protein
MPAISRAQPVIRIGHLAPRTGVLAPLGDHAVMGIELAAEEVNAAGGVNGHRIELLLEDSGDPLANTTKARRLVEHDGVAMLIGEVSPESGLTVARITEHFGIVFIDTARNASTMGGAACGRYVFRVETGNSPLPKNYVERFTRRYGKPPENRAWSDYAALKIAALSMAGIDSRLRSNSLPWAPFIRGVADET